MPKISELAAAASATDADQLAVNQGGTTRRLTVAQVRAGLASASHTHVIADVANLQASLDAKQPIDSDLTALATNAANGLWARTGDGTGAARTITGGTGITVANGNGVSGNPTVSLNFTLANIPQSGATTGQVLKWNGSAWAPANDETATGGGGVSSVGLSLPAQFSVTGSPVTSSGTLTAAWASQAQNAILAGPASGGAGTPSFRALSAADLPAQAVQTSRQVTAGTGLTGGGDLAADRSFALTGQALALHSLGTNGMIVRTGAGTVAARAITGGTGITVSNGDGVSGNPTVALNFTLANIPQSGAAAGQVLKWNGTAWAPGNDDAGTGSAATAVITATAFATYQATGLTGNCVIKLTLGGNTAITTPTFTGLAANSVYFIRYELTASGATRTPSFSGYTLAVGVNPARAVPDGASLFVDTEAHTDATGAVTLHRLVGAYDAGSEPPEPLAQDDRIVFSDTSDSGRPKSATVSEIRDLPGRAVAFTDHIPITGNGTYTILEDNTILGMVMGITHRCNAGSLTANLQIANHTGPSDLTPTGAASITGLSAVSVGTASARATASGANTMGKSGTAGRVLQVVVTGATGSPTVLTLTVRGMT
jgi:hypothetical protein